MSQPPENQTRSRHRQGWTLPEQHQGLRVSSQAELQRAADAGRSKCPKCNNSRFLYCHDCILPLTDVPKLPPLPFPKFSILTDPAEKRTNNTGIHIKMLAPDHVDLHRVEDSPNFDPTRALVLYPSNDALSPADIIPGSIDRVFLIDSKWSKAKTISQHPVLAQVRHVKLRNYKTSFWRYHSKRGTSDESICTIEAIYFFLKEHCQAQSGRHATSSEGVCEDCHCYDDVLWYFDFQHELIEQRKKKEDEERKKKRERNDDKNDDEEDEGGKRAKPDA